MTEKVTGNGLDSSGSDIGELIADLEDISGIYDTHRVDTPYLVSNDRGYQQISDKLKTWLSQPRDLALIVGSGGHLSMLPDIDAQAIILLDHNEMVLEFNQLLAEIIQGSDSASRAVDEITDIDAMDLQTLKKIVSFGTFRTELYDESVEYGFDHWTNKNRFHEVAKALGRIPIVYLAADIANPDFRKVFTETLQRHNHRLSLLNLTNVHDYAGDKDIPAKLPLDDDPMILYSKHGQQFAKGLVMGIAHSADEYREKLKFAK